MPPEQQVPQQPAPQPMPQQPVPLQQPMQPQPMQMPPMQPQQPMQQPVQQFAPQPMQQPFQQPVPQQFQQPAPMNGYGPMQAQQMPSGGLALIKSPFVLVLLAGSVLAILGSIMKWISFKSTNATLISLANEKMNEKYMVVIGISLAIVVSTLLALKLQKRFAPIGLILISVYSLAVVFNQRLGADEARIGSNSIGWYLSLVGVLMQTVGLGLVTMMLFKRHAASSIR